MSASGLLVCSHTSNRRLTPPALDLSASGLWRGASDWSTSTKHPVLKEPDRKLISLECGADPTWGFLFASKSLLGAWCFAKRRRDETSESVLLQTQNTNMAEESTHTNEDEFTLVNHLQQSV